MRKTSDYLDYYKKVGTFAAMLNTNSYIFMKTFCSWLVCLFIYMFSFSLFSCSSDSEIDNILGNKADNGSKPSLTTLIIDGKSQPPLVGGILNEYSDGIFAQKGILVSPSKDNIELSDATHFRIRNAAWYSRDMINMAIDCSESSSEQFTCWVKGLEGGRTYFIRAFAKTKEGEILYGDIQTVSTQNFIRSDSSYDYANVFEWKKCTLFDLVSDEIIDPIYDGFYYSTNEMPDICDYQIGTSFNTCYKYISKWNYKLWRIYAFYLSNITKVDMPSMSMDGDKLVISSQKGTHIFYSINGNGLHPESFKDEYKSPIRLSSPCIVYSYAIDSEGTVSYTNAYMYGTVEQGGSSSGDENGIEDSPSFSQSDCSVVIDGEDYYIEQPMFSYLSYRPAHNNCFAYDNRPLYSQYHLFVVPKDDNMYSTIIYIDVNVPDFGSDFAFTAKNTTLGCVKTPFTPDYLLASGSAKVTSFNSISCTTEFNNCEFKNVENDKVIKINGKITINVTTRKY